MVLKLNYIVFKVRVSSFVLFGGQTSMTFEMFSLKRPCMAMYVLSCFICLSLNKIVWYVLTSYTNIIGLKTSGYDSTQDPQRGPKRGPELRDQHCRAVAKRWNSRRPVG